MFQPFQSFKLLHVLMVVSFGVAVPAWAERHAVPIPAPAKPWSLSTTDPKDAGCTIPPEWKTCERQPLAKNEKWRDIYDPWILEAANAYSIHPALLKAIAHVESTMNPIAGSNSAPNGLMSDPYKNDVLKLKGVESDTDLWLAPASKPTAATALSTEYNIFKKGTHPITKAACEVFPFWSPRGQIWAAASYLRTLSKSTFSVEAVGKDGKKHRYPIQNLLMSDLRDPNWVQRARYLSAMYNKGPFASQRAVDAFYQTNEKIPQDFGPAWDLMQDDHWNTYKFKTFTWELSQEHWHTAKCYVWKVAGLCGGTPEGLFKDYLSDFAFNVKTAKWYRVRAAAALKK